MPTSGSNDGERSTEGRYANVFHVGHNVAEFVIDFGQYFPEGGAQQIHTRIVMSPLYARELLRVLSEAIAAYDGETAAGR